MSYPTPEKVNPRELLLKLKKNLAAFEELAPDYKPKVNRKGVWKGRRYTESLSHAEWEVLDRLLPDPQHVCDEVGFVYMQGWVS